MSDVIDDVAMLGDQLGVKTPEGVTLLDPASLEPCGRLAGRAPGTLAALPDGRFLVHRADSLGFHVGRRGDPELAHVEAEGDLSLFSSFIPTPRGYLAVAFRGLLVDVAGARTVVTVAGCTEHGGAPWRGGAAIAGFEGVAIVTAEGRVRAAAPGLHASRCPVALPRPGLLAVASADAIRLLDDDARVVATIERGLSSWDHLVAFDQGLLVRTYDADRTSTSVTHWVLAEDGTLVERWTLQRKAHLAEPMVVGDWIVLESYDGGTWIHDRDGRELAALPTKGHIDSTAAFGGGIVLSERHTYAATWWRPGHDVVPLAHDSAPAVLRELPGGRLASTDGAALNVWDEREPGPERTTVRSSMPLGVPLHLRGEGFVTVLEPGWHRMRARTLAGDALAVSPDAEWRPLATRDEAAAVVARLVARDLGDPVPAIDGDDALAHLPPAESVGLHGRALFAASTLDAELRERVIANRPAFFDELAHALGTSRRALLAAVRARKLALVPPRPVPGHEYLGTFTTSGELIVSDPCYRGKKTHPAVLSLSHSLAARDGVWHAFVRPSDDGRYTAELVAIHEAGFDVAASEVVAMVGVDSGTMGIVDKHAPTRDPADALEEGTYAALGVIVHSGWGDGAYPVYVGRAHGTAAKVRVHFIGDTPELDRTLTRRGAAARPYQIKTTYVVGDTIEHPKFGTGAVVRVGGDGKIDVRFPDATRTLVHARK